MLRLTNALDNQQLGINNDMTSINADAHQKRQDTKNRYRTKDGLF